MPPGKINLQLAIGKNNKQIININADLDSSFVITDTITNTKISDNFIGRKSELDNLHEYIKGCNKTVIISGMGGMGKTTICNYIYSEYIDKHKKNIDCNVDCIGYLQYDEVGGLDVTLINGLKIERTKDIKKDITTAWTKLKDIGDKKKLLLIIDNVTIRYDKNKKPIKDTGLDKLNSINGCILMTSRYKDFGFEIYEIDKLTLHECTSIFKKTYNKYDYRLYEEDDLKYIVETLAARHTMTIIRLANIMKNKTWTVKKLRTELEKNGFNLSTHIYGEETSLIREHEKLLLMDNINDSELNILEAFSLFPYEFLDAETLRNWLFADAKVEEYSEILNGLYEKSWLEKDYNKFCIHPVYSELIYNKFRPSLESHINLIKECSDYLYYDYIGIFTEVLPYLKFCVSIARRINHMDSEILSDLYYNIGVVYQDIGDYEIALEYYKIALEITVKLLGKEHPDTAKLYGNIALVYYIIGIYEKSLEYNNMALEIRERVLGKEHQEVAETYNNIAGVYQAIGDYEKALKYYKMALEIIEKAFGKKHSNTASIYNNSAAVYVAIGDYEKALEYYKMALEIITKVSGNEHPNTASIYNNIGIVYEEMDNYEKALEYNKMALKIREKVLGTKHPDTAQSYNNIGVIYQIIGNHEKALEYDKMVLKIREKKFGKEHPDTAATYNNISVVYKAIGDYEKALEYNKIALEIAEKVLGKEHLNTATTYNNIAGVYKAMGDHEKAIEYYKLALEIRKKCLEKKIHIH